MTRPGEDIAGYMLGTLGVQACVADVVAWVKQKGPSGPCRWLATHGLNEMCSDLWRWQQYCGKSVQ